MRLARVMALSAALLAVPAGAPAEEESKAARVEVKRRSLKGEVYTERVRAAKALGEMGRDAVAATPELCAALVDRNPSVRQAAFEALEQVNPEMLAILFPIAADASESVRLSHIEKASGLGLEGHAAKPVLLFRFYQSIAPNSRSRRASMRSESEAVACLLALYAIARNDEEICDLFLDLALKSRGAELRAAAISHTAGLETRDLKRVIAVLTTVLKTDTTQMKLLAARELEKMGALAKPAIETLRQLKGSTSSEVRTTVEKVLKTIEAAQPKSSSLAPEPPPD